MMYGEKLILAGSRMFWTNFTRCRLRLRLDGREKKTVSEKKDLTSVTARPDGTAGNDRASEGTERNHQDRQYPGA
jgi:hypothetical protein